MNPFFKLFVKGHVWLYKSSGGKRGSTMQGMKIILLTTKGRKTGEPRTVPVVPYRDSERDRLWKGLTELMPNFGEYQKKTTRIIPVVHLVKRPS